MFDRDVELQWGAEGSNQMYNDVVLKEFMLKSTIRLLNLFCFILVEVGSALDYPLGKLIWFSSYYFC